MADEKNGADAMAGRLAAVVRDVLAPMVAADNGQIEWVGMDRGVAEIRLTGACSGCPGQQFTASAVVLPALRSIDPTIKSVRVKPSV